jgi:lysozyme family protein
MKRLILTAITYMVIVGTALAANPIEAMKNTFGQEGVLNCDRTDPGNLAADGTYGCTKFGVSHKSYPKVNIRNLTPESASAYMNQDFWLPLGLNKVDSQLIADFIFDMAWNQGEGTWARFIQQAINLSNDGKCPDIKVDGKIGPKTIGALNRMDQTEVAMNILVLAGGRYQHIALTNPKMKKMWYKAWMYRMKHNIIKSVHQYETKK